MPEQMVSPDEVRVCYHCAGEMKLEKALLGMATGNILLKFSCTNCKATKNEVRNGERNRGKGGGQGISAAG